ncbi:MAG TPA: extracellular solute-binding protein [Gaiellaceae bacterium]|jgi:putative spermidine/putrescine transport system substrate-binding protein
MSDRFEVDTDELVEQLREHQRLTGTEPREESSGMSRRDLLLRGGAAAAAVSGVGALAGTAAAAPAKSGKYTGTLRVITLGVEWPTPEVQKKAEADLGVKFALTVTDPVTMVQKAITAPETFDIFGGYNYQDIQMWSSHHLMPVDTRKITAWPQLYKLFAYGKVHPGAKGETYGDGDAPFRALFLKQGTSGLPLTKEGPKSNKDIVQWVVNEKTNATKGPMPRYIVGTPSFFNADSIGYNADVLTKLPNQVGWAELLNKKWKGKVALLKDPGIVMQDVGNALKAQGIFKPKDMGNMTPAEIDRVVKIATQYKKAGQFRAYWANFNESVNLMASKEVVVESMWSPAVALLVAQGINVKYASPPTGFRGWCGSVGIAAHVASDPAKLQACYDLLNWQFEGWLGATIMRQGYYTGNGNSLLNWIKTKGASNPAGGIPFQADEYAFWYGGARAARDLPGITGKVGDIKKGSTRDGGGFSKRIGHYSSWNSYFTNNAYQIKRWNDFLSA